MRSFGHRSHRSSTSGHRSSPILVLRVEESPRRRTRPFAEHYGWELLLAVGSFLPPYPTYRVLPRHMRGSGLWMGVLFIYGFLFTLAVTFLSVCQVFGSSRSRPAFLLRALLLALALAAELSSAFFLLAHPSTTASYGSWLLLLVVYIGAWYGQCRRRRG